MSLSQERAFACTDIELARAYEPIAGNAVDVVVAGVLAACGLDASVLLGSLQVLVAGPGMGLYALDGRCRQPGLGAKRPRGFLPNASIPPAARVAAPALPATLAAASTLFGTRQLRDLSGPGLSLASARSKERQAVLERFAQRGARALEEGLPAEELRMLAGPLAGGNLSPTDLVALAIQPVAAREHALGGLRAADFPWAPALGDAESKPHTDAGNYEVLCATDSKGTVCIASYLRSEGLALPQLGLIAPLLAHPVLRGSARIAPGTPLRAGGAAALVAGPRGWQLAVGAAHLPGAQVGLLRVLGHADSLTEVERSLTAHGSGGRWSLVVTGERAARGVTFDLLERDTQRVV